MSITNSVRTQKLLWTHESGKNGHLVRNGTSWENEKVEFKGGLSRGGQGNGNIQIPSWKAAHLRFPCKLIYPPMMRGAAQARGWVEKLRCFWVGNCFNHGSCMGLGFNSCNYVSPPRSVENLHCYVMFYSASPHRSANFAYINYHLVWKWFFI